MCGGAQHGVVSPTLRWCVCVCMVLTMLQHWCIMITDIYMHACMHCCCICGHMFEYKGLLVSCVVMCIPVFS